MAFVVFMLFAVAVAGATGYLVVASEFELSSHSSEGAKALTAARAGLERYVAEQMGVLDDTVSYALGDGIAEVTSRKLLEQDSLTYMYYIRSEATVVGAGTTATPARRVVGAYAIYHRRPLAHHAVLMISTAEINAHVASETGTIRGYDHDTAGDCPGGGATGITGAIARVAVTEDNSSQIQATPESEIWSGGYSQMLDSIGLRWDVLKDPQFPVDFDDVWPDFSTLPSDSFPVVRRTGWTSASGINGRGVLIVDGTFDGSSTFSWRGIIIAKEVDDYIEGDLSGILVGGLDSNNYYNTVWWSGDAEYHSCDVYAANEALSYLELIPNTIHETN